MAALPLPGPARGSEPLPRFGLVVVAIFAELMVAPFIAGLPGALVVVRTVTVALLLWALWIAGARRTAVLMYAPVLATQLAASYAEAPLVEAIAAALHCVLLVYIFGFILTRVARARDVSIDTIAGAAFAYLLIALIWADLYLLLVLFQPGSIQIPSDWAVGSGRDLRASLTYYSFVTMTTVGHVFDVSGPAAGGLGVAETLLGQLYLAVLIARIVGLHTSGAATPSATGGAGGGDLVNRDPERERTP